MDAPIPEQAAIVGSLWPDWAPSTWLEIQFLKIAIEERFSVVKDDTIRKKHVHRFECAEEPDEGDLEYCPCGWTVTTNIRTGETTTTDVHMQHAHELPAEGSKRARAIVAENEAILVDAVAELERLATERFEHFLKMAAYREGFKDRQNPRDLTPAAMQELVVWDLKVALGEQEASAFEARMRAGKRMADDYPAISTLKGLHPMQAPLELRLPVAATEGASPSTWSSSRAGGDIVINYSLTGIALASSSPAERSPTPPPVSQSSVPTFLRNTFMFPDWATLDQAMTTYAMSEGFQVETRNVAIDEPFLTLGCSEQGCGWGVAVGPTAGSERIFLQEHSCFVHTHGAMGAKAAKRKGKSTAKPSPQAKKRKAPAKEQKARALPCSSAFPADHTFSQQSARQKKKGKAVRFDSSSPPPPATTRGGSSRKCKLPPPVEYSDGGSDEEIIALRDEDDPPAPAPAHSPELHYPEAYAPVASITPSAAAPARAASPADSDRTLVEHRAEFSLTGLAPSAAYAASIARASQVPKVEPSTDEGVPAAGPSTGTTAVEQPVARPDELEAYLSALDPSGAFSASDAQLAPLLRSYGIHDPAQLERAYGRCAAMVLEMLAADGVGPVMVKMFQSEMETRVEVKQEEDAEVGVVQKEEKAENVVQEEKAQDVAQEEEQAQEA